MKSGIWDSGIDWVDEKRDSGFVDSGFDRVDIAGIK
jgi:hypothetical protein